MSVGGDASFGARYGDGLLGRFAGAVDGIAENDGLRTIAIDSAFNGGKMTSRKGGMGYGYKSARNVRGMDALAREMRSREIEAACALLGKRCVAADYGRSRLASGNRCGSTD